MSRNILVREVSRDVGGFEGKTTFAPYKGFAVWKTQWFLHLLRVTRARTNHIDSLHLSSKWNILTHKDTFESYCSSNLLTERPLVCLNEE